MKVVFIEDVPDVALAGETKEVADGYGRNYLLPKKLAVLANSAASNIVKAQMKKVVVKRTQEAAEMAGVAEKINGAEITLIAKVGEKEHLYGSVTGADIAAELHNSTGQVVDKRKIDLEEPIRQLGTYDLTVRFTHDITAAIRVTVEGDKVAVEKEEKEERKPRAKKESSAEDAEALAEAGIDSVYELIESSSVTATDAAVVADEDAEAVSETAEAKVEEVTAAVEEEPAKEKKAKKPKAKKAKKAVEEVAATVEEEPAEEKKAKKPKAKKAKKAAKTEAPVAEPEAKLEEGPPIEDSTKEKETEPGE